MHFCLTFMFNYCIIFVVQKESWCYMNDIYNDYTNKLNDISFQISNTDENNLSFSIPP